MKALFKFKSWIKNDKASVLVIILSHLVVFNGGKAEVKSWRKIQYEMNEKKIENLTCKMEKRGE